MDNDAADRVIERLDLLIALFRLSNSAAIQAASDAVYADSTNSAILGATEDWVPAGELKRFAMAGGRVAKATAERRIADLVQGGVLLVSGAGPATKYKRSGLL
jgi:hypothetical protein